MELWRGRNAFDIPQTWLRSLLHANCASRKKRKNETACVDITYCGCYSIGQELHHVVRLVCTGASSSVTKATVPGSIAVWVVDRRRGRLPARPGPAWRVWEGREVGRVLSWRPSSLLRPRSPRSRARLNLVIRQKASASASAADKEQPRPTAATSPRRGLSPLGWRSHLDQAKTIKIRNASIA